jgi:hypothetical protein
MTAKTSKPVISMFGSGRMMNVPGRVTKRAANAPGSVSPVARSLATPVPFHSVTTTVTASSNITTGITTAGRWSAQRVDVGCQGPPARGRPVTFALRPAGGVPRGHSEVDWGG